MYYSEPTQILIEINNRSALGIGYKDEVIDLTCGKVYPADNVKVNEKSEWCPLVDKSNENSVIMWNKVFCRTLTEDEVNLYIANGTEEDWIPEYTFLTPMPKDGERILLKTPWGTDIDQCVVKNDGVLDIYLLDEYDTWDGITEWAYLPE